jgi:protocatechuate 3,4-dioxygenase beta subunit
MYRRFGYLICVLAIALMSGPWVHSQKGTVKVAPSTGTLIGEVFDHHGTPLAGTAVTVTNIDKQLSQQTTTDAQGVFRVDALVPGEYELTYEAKNFVVLKQKTKIKVGKTAKVHAHLKYIEPSS